MGMSAFQAQMAYSIEQCICDHLNQESDREVAVREAATEIVNVLAKPIVPPVMAIPLTLTSRQQSAMADLCSVMRSLVYNAGNDRAIDGDRLVDDLCAIADRYQLSPQDFDTLYDRFHRSGANA
jgi:hypothetical protein